MAEAEEQAETVLREPLNLVGCLGNPRRAGEIETDAIGATKARDPARSDLRLENGSARWGGWGGGDC